MSGVLLEDVNYLVLGGVYPLGGRSAVGLGYAGGFVSGIEIRNSSGALSRRANYGSGVFVAGYGKKLTNLFSLGLTLKYYLNDGSEVDSGDGSGWNLDLGVLQRGTDWLSFGLTARNLLSSQKINYQSGASEHLPQIIRAGVRLNLFELSILLDGRYNPQTSSAAELHAGIEFSPLPALALRGGWDAAHPTAGLTLKVAGLEFHYAYRQITEFTGGAANFFSLTFNERDWPPETPPDVFLAKRRPM